MSVIDDIAAQVDGRSSPDPEVRAEAWRAIAMDLADRVVEAHDRAAEYADRLARHAQSTQCSFWPDA